MNILLAAILISFTTPDVDNIFNKLDKQLSAKASQPLEKAEGIYGELLPDFSFGIFAIWVDEKGDLTSAETETPKFLTSMQEVAVLLAFQNKYKVHIDWCHRFRPSINKDVDEVIAMANKLRERRTLGTAILNIENGKVKERVTIPLKYTVLNQKEQVQKYLDKIHGDKVVIVSYLTIDWVDEKEKSMEVPR